MAITNDNYKGKGLSFLIGSTEYNMDIDSFQLTSDDKEIITFADMTNGTRQWTLTVNVKIDAATGSVWNYVWVNAGTTGVAFTAKPYGGTASATKPWITGTVTIPHKPDFTVDANSLATVDIAFDVTGEPTLATS